MSNPNIVARIGVLRLGLLISTALCYPLVLLSDMEPEGIGVLTAYVVPSLVVIFFFVLLLDALMNRIFMIEQEADEVATRRLRMGSYFRSIGTL